MCQTEEGGVVISCHRTAGWLGRELKNASVESCLVQCQPEDLWEQSPGHVQGVMLITVESLC